MEGMVDYSYVRSIEYQGDGEKVIFFAIKMLFLLVHCQGDTLKFPQIG